ncbi:IS3 family transposase [Psychrobacillus vulpis]|uniref:IS3 family transposase n=1 Tax=Psychrobacillus vulpis TaxID=2325572 RepID=A0A544TG06_9BACI|nr:IS3 family transposase [Psychrobacillus vulpis]TQR16347.1 IS3 family transposase [Psychrobacillus vulpis]
MSKIYFNEHQRQLLEANPNVASVSDRAIQYTPEFKINAVKENLAGKGPTQIFIENGFDLEMIGPKKAKSSLNRWRNTFNQYGENGFLEERRGKGSTGRPSTNNLSADKKLEKAEARIRYLEAEIELLKKLEEPRKEGEETQVEPHEIYEVINEVIRKYQLTNSVSELCAVAHVSRSGYYAWLQNTEKHAIRENNDYEDYLFLRCIYDAFNGKIGYRGLYMKVCELLGNPMNPKKIRRLMRKYNFFAKVRRANPYKNIAKATQEHKTLPNLLNREFTQDEPGKVFLTDITYLKYRGKTAYLSCVKDVASREIVAYELSQTLKMSIVFHTLRKLDEKLDGNVHPEAMIHSDQGFHYTHPEFQKSVKQMNLKQSMSRRGNCIDNAPMESFFGHMKDEMDYKQVQTFEDLKQLVNQYMIFYNESRRQWNLKKMTPAEYRSHLIAA